MRPNPLYSIAPLQQKARGRINWIIGQILWRHFRLSSSYSLCVLYSVSFGPFWKLWHILAQVDEGRVSAATVERWYNQIRTLQFDSSTIEESFFCGGRMHAGNWCGSPPHWHCIPQETIQSAPNIHYTALLYVILLQFGQNVLPRIRLHFFVLPYTSVLLHYHVLLLNSTSVHLSIV